MSHHLSAGQFMELCVDPDELFVRIDLYNKSVTTGFKEWLSWNVDTAQVEVASGVFHFVDPDGNLVGTKNCTIKGGLPRRHCYE